jgi:biotin carboxyl carrier protein
MYDVKVNGQYHHQVEIKEDGLFVDGQAYDLDRVQLEDDLYHVIKDKKSIMAEVVSTDYEAKTLIIRVNGNDYEVQLKDQYDLLLERLGMSDIASRKVNEIKAPMPGLVLNVDVSEGDEITKDQQVLVLEAMKMENVLKAPGNGVVKAVNANQGDKVEKNQVLVTLE